MTQTEPMISYLVDKVFCSDFSKQSATNDRPPVPLDDATNKRLWEAAKKEAIELEGCLDFHHAMSIYDSLTEEELHRRKQQDQDSL